MCIRNAVLSEALGWRGTPYVHGASLKGLGCDCIGLVRGVWRAVYGAEPQAMPAYTPDWDDMSWDERLLSALNRHFEPIELDAAMPGDVLAFRMVAGAVVKHVAILSYQRGERAQMVHAYWGRAAVESWMGPWWRRRLVAAFSFPERE